MKISNAVLAIFLSLSATSQIHADDDNTEIIVDYAPEPQKPEENDQVFFIPPIEEIFENPTLALGLASGADAINHSVESLMKALFYSLLDNEFRYDLTSSIWLTGALTRDVFSNLDGSYVVVDRIDAGPNYLINLPPLAGTPLSFAVNGRISMLEIYLTSDGLRVANDENISKFRSIANNWFGALPLLSRVLPPSFNPNELYDPIRQLEVPLFFPWSASIFEKMPIGSIRSYAFSAGARISADLTTKFGKNIINLVEKAGQKFVLPYSIFSDGEYRINVLRKSKHIAWVGMSRNNRVGHSIDGFIGQTFRLFANALPFWNGVPGGFFPLIRGIQTQWGNALIRCLNSTSVRR